MKRYTEYKDSGIEWLGEIPNEWEIKQMKHIISSEPYSMVDGPFGSDMKNEEYVDSGIPIIQLNNIGIGEHKLNTINYITENKAEQLKRHKAYAGEIVMAKMAEPVARATILSNEYEQYIVSADCIRVKVSSVVDSKFIVYALNSYMRKEAEILSTGTTRIRINLSIAKNLHIAVPPLSQQSKITDYLDRKTAGIDNLIADKQKLIDLLREKRQTTISEAVTKGLDKTVQMKDSGIEWIGEIPEGWEVACIKYVADVQYGLGQPPETSDYGLPLIRATNIFRGKINNQDMLYVQPDSVPTSRNAFLTKGDILVVRSGAYTGDSAIITEEYNGAVAGYDMVLHPKIIEPKFLALCLLSKYVLQDQLGLLMLRAAQPHLNAEELGNAYICLPDSKEQNRIIHYVYKKISEIDNVISDMTTQIEKLNEYRQAVISEVVTGKVAV